MMRAMRNYLLILLPISTLACSFHARSPDQYRDDTRALLESRGGKIKDCYRDALEATNETTGTVTVNFTVEKKTGQLSNIRAAEQSTAPEPLRECVVKALEGLSLSPPDARDGVATFRYEFEPEA